MECTKADADSAAYQRYCAIARGAGGAILNMQIREENRKLQGKNVY
jgi:hypothetical protein